jgi:dGTPase
VEDERFFIPPEKREDRRHQTGVDDQRTPFQRDRDRILYSSAFRRLAGITQIARAGEADVFHTRLAHTLKVAQVGRRIAENIIRTQPEEAAAVGVDPEVTEAACLAHDLGHPPFGHHGEHVLNDCVTRAGDTDGYEGNAQSLRVLTQLSVRYEDCKGLNLTRATLAGCIKYPWIRTADHPLKAKKWGYYSTEQDDFSFARDNSTSETKTAEAELMDWADDIAYSVHDLEDFHRCRLIPWREVLSFDGRDRLLAGMKLLPEGEKKPLAAAHRRLRKLVEGTVGDLLDQPYDATREQRRAIRLITSTLIGRYVTSIKLSVPSEPGGHCVSIDAAVQAEVTLLKQIAREFILKRPALAAQQRGQGRILSDLFDDLFALGSEAYLPERFADLFSPGVSRPRCVADCIASLTEKEAVALHGRLRGLDSGSVLDPIVR